MGNRKMRIKRFVLGCSAVAALLGLLQFSNPTAVRSSGRSLLQIYTSGTETLSISSDGTMTSSGTFTMGLSTITEHVSNAAKRVKEHAQTVKEHVEKRLETVKEHVKQHADSIKEHVEERMERMKQRADHCAKALGAHAGHLKQHTNLLLHRLTAVHAKPVKQRQGVSTTEQPAEPKPSASVE